MNNYNIKNEEQYFNEIAKLLKKLNKNTAEEINEKLDSIYNFKPVRLEWLYAKIDVLLELNTDTEDYKNLLYCYYWALKNCEKHEKLLKYLIRLNNQSNNTMEEERLKFELYLNSAEVVSEEQAHYENMFEVFSTMLINFIENNYTKEDIKKIIEIAYITSDFTLVSIFENIYSHQYNENIQTSEIILSRPNIFYFNNILNNENNTFTIVFDSNNELIILAVVKALKRLGHNIFIISEPQNFEVDNEIDITQTVEISLETLEKNNDYQTLIPVRIIKDNQIISDNIPHLISYISNNLTKEKLATVIAFNSYMYPATAEIGANRFLETLYVNPSPYDTLAFGWSGDYCSYMDKLYNTNSKKLLTEKSNVDFSIIIPVRNDSSNTLYSTIKTCLDINYDNNKFEIVISDNSTHGNTKVKQTVNKFNDERIKYFKTPYEFSLPKSFEFACLMSKGEYLIPIGADDGVVPNALTVLSEAFKKHPEHELILWKRGFYAWPGFNSTQQNQFSISTDATNNYECSTIQSSELWASILKNPNLMYTIPLFYINSGFKRSYFHTLLSKTGTLFNGPCQDIYTGVVNISINNQILFINNQLTFAGMSSSSIGANYNIAKIQIPKISVPVEFNNIYNDSYLESYIPNTWNDKGTLYKSIMRVISKGLLPKSFIEDLFDFKSFYINMLSHVKKDDIMFEMTMELFKKASKQLGNDFHNWFVDTYYHINFEPVYIENVDEPITPQTEHCYNIGFRANSLTLDASEFGVRNIHDAIKLYTKLTGI